MNKVVAAPQRVIERPFGVVDETVSDEHRKRMRAPMIAGGLTVLIFVVGFFVWSSIFTIAGGVTAPGVVIVENMRKSVEQPDGGVIRQILVHDGDHVSKGQVVMVLDDTQARAQRDVLANGYDTLLAQKARLEAEISDQPKITFPPELLARAGEPSVAQAIHDQQTLFDAGRAVYIGQIGVLNQRIQQMQSRTEGLKAQVTAVDQENALVQDELDGVSTLYSEGFAPKSRMQDLQRMQAGLVGERGSHQADIASSGQAVGETQIQLAEVKAQRSAQAADTLRQVQSQIADISPRLAAAQAVLDRTVVRSPAQGQVFAQAVFTEGGVAKPGERLMDVVPDNTPLMIRVNVKPTFIDEVKVGSPAQVRLMTSQSRVTPPLNGVVAVVAADLVLDERNPNPTSGVFPVDVSVSPSELKKLGHIKLTAGMTASAIIVTAQRSILSYLASPFTQTFGAALHEN